VEIVSLNAIAATTQEAAGRRPADHLEAIWYATGIMITTKNLRVVQLVSLLRTHKVLRQNGLLPIHGCRSVTSADYCLAISELIGL